MVVLGITVYWPLPRFYGEDGANITPNCRVPEEIVDGPGMETRKLRKNKRCKKRWSGLSESNRHLNLGKVPYYHYTKAALLLFFL